MPVHMTCIARRSCWNLQFRLCRMYVFGAGRMPARLKPSGSRAPASWVSARPSLFHQVVHSYFYQLASLIFRLVGNTHNSFRIFKRGKTPILQGCLKCDTVISQNGCTRWIKNEINTSLYLNKTYFWEIDIKYTFYVCW